MSESNVISEPKSFEWNDGRLGRVFRVRKLDSGGIQMELKGGAMNVKPNFGAGAHAGFLTTPEGAADLLTGLQAWIEQLENMLTHI